MQENPSSQQTLCPMNFKPSRPDLMRMNFHRHLNECKSLITFLGSFVDYEDIRKEINTHITNLQNSKENDI